MQHIVIVGNGIAGITAARHLRKLGNHAITVISGETEHFFSRTALMYLYMGHMKYEHTKPYEDWFWEKNKIQLRQAWVASLDHDRKTLTLHTGEFIRYDRLILATGSRSNKPGWPGQELAGVQGLYSIQDLELMEKNTAGIRHAVIVGGGLIGVEMAEMLHSREIAVTYLIREKHFWGSVLPREEGELIIRHLQRQGIHLLKETELESIDDDGRGRVGSVTTKDRQTIPCQFVGLTVGVHPNLDLVKNTTIETDKGILVNDLLQTSIPGVYAIGDCAQLRNPQPHRKAIEAVWYVGRMMGETVARTLSGTPTPYRPGVWFNSAKFFDIEYQTYGYVPGHDNARADSFFWQSEAKDKCLRIAFDPVTKVVKGVNLLGIRGRHETWDHWIRHEATLQQVIQDLHRANFDPEFSEKYEPEIRRYYNTTFPDAPANPGKRSFFEKVFS